MRMGILGSGGVGQTVAAGLTRAGVEVMVGTRDPQATLSRPAAAGTQSFADWSTEHPEIAVGTFAEAARFGDAVILAVNGMAAEQVLQDAGPEALGQKILLDLTNPLDFSAGFPPTLFVSNTDSLAETLQRGFPQVRVVKTLNTVNAALMVSPDSLAGGDHTVFVSGDDDAAKQQVAQWLGEWFGWRDVIDLGDITTARGTEELLALWVRLMGTLGTPRFQFKVVR